MARSVRLAEAEPHVKRVGLWIRVSTEDQANGESPEHHEARGQAYALVKGWQVVEVYQLGGVSGKAILGHPETKRMLRHIETGHITGLIFSKLARLARNTRDLLELADFFQRHGADLISLQESIDTSTPAGRLFYTMIAAMAQWEREEIAERVAASVPIRAKLGKPLGGQAPFGYDWKDARLLPNPDEAPVRRLIYELFADLRRKKAVARRLNEMGHRTRGGRLFTDTTIDRLLRDPTAKGLRRANYTKSRGAKRGWDRKPESEWVHIPVDPIVPQELWDRCNQILDQQRINRTPPSRRPVQLFGGLTWCACGHKMYVVSNSPKYVCQKCRNKLPIEDLETVFLDQLKGFLLSPEDVRRHLDSADRGIAEKKELITGLEREHAKVRQEMDQVYRLYIDGQINPAGFGERHRPLETRLAQIDDELPRLQAETDLLRINLLSQDEVISQAHDLFHRWPDLDLPAKRTIVENLVERITIGQDDIAIDLFYLPVASPTGPPPTNHDPALPHTDTTDTPDLRSDSELLATGPHINTDSSSRTA